MLGPGSREKLPIPSQARCCLTSEKKPGTSLASRTDRQRQLNPLAAAQENTPSAPIGPTFYYFLQGSTPHSLPTHVPSRKGRVKLGGFILGGTMTPGHVKNKQHALAPLGSTMC